MNSKEFLEFAAYAVVVVALFSLLIFWAMI